MAGHILVATHLVTLLARASLRSSLSSGTLSSQRTMQLELNLPASDTRAAPGPGVPGSTPPHPSLTHRWARGTWEAFRSRWALETKKKKKKSKVDHSDWRKWAMRGQVRGWGRRRDGARRQEARWAAPLSQQDSSPQSVQGSPLLSELLDWPLHWSCLLLAPCNPASHRLPSLLQHSLDYNTLASKPSTAPCCQLNEDHAGHQC